MFDFKIKTTKGYKESFGGDGYIYYLDCDDANVTVHKGLNNSSNCMINYV